MSRVRDLTSSVRPDPVLEAASPVRQIRATSAYLFQMNFWLAFEKSICFDSRMSEGVKRARKSNEPLPAKLYQYIPARRRGEARSASPAQLSFLRKLGVSDEDLLKSLGPLQASHFIEGINYEQSGQRKFQITLNPDGTETEEVIPIGGWKFRRKSISTPQKVSTWKPVLMFLIFAGFLLLFAVYQRNHS